MEIRCLICNKRLILSELCFCQKCGHYVCPRHAYKKNVRHMGVWEERHTCYNCMEHEQMKLDEEGRARRWA